MVRVERSVLVPAPLSEVFAYASDYRRWEEWFEGVSGFRAISKTTRGDGAQYAYQAQVAWFRVGVVTEITEFAENAGWRGVSRKGIPHATSWRFEEVGDQTRFTYAVEGRIPVPLLGSLVEEAMLKPQWQRIVEASLANLRRRFESPGATHRPATGGA